MAATFTFPATIRGMSVHRKRSTPLGLGVSFEHFIFALLYALALQQCYLTAGVPYQNALAHYTARKAAETAVLAGVTANATLAADLAAANASASAPLDAPLPDDYDPFAEGSAAAATKAAPAAAKAAASTQPAWSDSVSFGQDGDEEGPPLPARYLPAFWALLLMAVCFLLHIISQLAQHWSIAFQTFIKCVPVADVAPGCVLMMTPPLHQGKAQLVPVQQFTRSDGTHGLMFMFQRQRYELERGAGGAWAVVQLPYPVTHPITYYLASKGLSPADAADKPGTLRDRFGRNDFTIPMPRFFELYKEQLLGPVTQFQLFSAGLWIMDEYWKYALFNIAMILMFEGTTAFTRLRSLHTLRGMGHRSRMVQALRGGVWAEVASEDLLPGDVISLVKSNKPEDEGVVPVDCLLLAGGAVVNEANLTGESVPQMKEAAHADSAAAGSAPLDLMGVHRVHVLYSGTTLMQHTAGDKAEHRGRPAPPDGGAVCFVLRTGFASSQGALMRMIEFSQEQVTGDTRETLVLLFILLFFAIVSAGHVLREGLREGKRSQYELMLRCVLILTAVVPPELPMQTALAVNTSLMALFKNHVFCTEPYRIPYAGKVDMCLFDKTGTLTTDKLQAVGVVNWEAGGSSGGSGGGDSGAKGGVRQPAPMANASVDVCVVLAGCHALLEVDGKLMGDPIETAALKAVDFVYKPANHTATPGTKLVGDKRPWAVKAGERPSVKILHRYHFSSALQRMAVLARVALDGGAEAQTWALVKGSPEAVGSLLAAKPAGYDATYRHMAERGMRVLALAVKTVAAPRPGEEVAREAVESQLRFVGFVAFSCLVRGDTAAIVQRLQQGACHVAMVTGDAALTALHVARDVRICDPAAPPEMPLLLDAPEAGGALEWVSARLDPATGKPRSRVPYDAAGMRALVAVGHDLVVTGAGLRAAAAASAATWEHLEHVRVFARMSPEDKEAVLKSLRAGGHYTMMCGDGANDVGALKQAHVGLALLSGFGDANTRVQAPEAAALTKAQKKAADEATRKAMSAKWAEERAKEKAELMALQQVYLAEEMEKFKGQPYAQFKALRSASMRLYAEQKSRQEERMKRFGGMHPMQMQATHMLEDMDEGDLPRVKLGDASIAAPFTYKLPSIAAAVDIVRQGRCALVNTTQQQQTLALNCLISAYSLSALYLDGIKHGESQMIATGVLLTVASMSFSFARSVDELSPVRPLRSIFHPAYALSLVGQLLIHLGCMVIAFRLAKEFEPDGPGSCAACGPARPPLSKGKGFLADLSRAVEEEYSKQREKAGLPEEEELKGYKFTPSLLNTVVFLVTTAQQVSVMLVNYKGRPFMQSVTENPAFAWSILMCCAGAFFCAFERIPELNQMLQLVTMPSDDFRWKVLKLLGATTLGALLWDRLCLAVFAPTVFWASLRAGMQMDLDAWWNSTRKTTMWVMTFVALFGSNFSLPVCIAVYIAYRSDLYK